MSVVSQTPAVRNRRLSIAILTLGILQLNGNAISAGLAEIGKAFPDHAQSTVSLLLTVSNAAIVPGMLIAGALAHRLGARRLIFGGFVLALVTGLASFFARDFTMLMVARILTGLGVGMIAPFQTSLIPDYFTGHAVQRLFGLQIAGVSILGVFYGVVGGWLTGFGWNYIFLVYLVALWGIAMSVTWMPDGRVVDDGARPDKKPFRLNRILAYATAIHCVFAICMFEFAAGISYLIEETGTGDAETAGICVSLFSLGSFATSLLYGRLARRFGIAILPWGLLVTTMGLLVVGQVRGLVAVYAGSLLLGSSIGLILPPLSDRITATYQNSNAALAISVFMGAFFVVQLFAGYVMDGVSLLPGGLTEAGRFMYAAILTAALTLATALTWRRFLPVARPSP